MSQHEAPQPRSLEADENAEKTTDKSDGENAEKTTDGLSTKPSSAKSQKEDNLGGEDVILFLIASRILNALVLHTFFQPDEYFQALEPGWNFAFGPGSGAWITWEWKDFLRSSIHPVLFGVVYKLADVLSARLGLTAAWKANLFLAAPRMAQALFAAAGEYYTWRLAEYVYGHSSLATAATLILTVVSPWQWFCSTRTFSNSLEATLTILALYNWPWHWSVAGEEGKGGLPVDADGLRIREDRDRSSGSATAGAEISSLRWALLVAAFASLLRPTNILIWIALAALAVLRGASNHWQVRSASSAQPALAAPSRSECIVVVREVVFCGSIALGLSAILDRIFYHAWTFPPLNFLYFNVVQSLAIFYGNNDWHYYLSQGYPLLLTTALPFALVGIYNAVTRRNPMKLRQKTILADLAIISLFVPAALSVISHKEVRFIYPLLPGLHILAAQPVSTFFAPVFQKAVFASARRSKQLKASLLVLLLGLNLTIAIYTSQIHNSGLINVMHYLRGEFEGHYNAAGVVSSVKSTNMTVGFLMPCHSTPWRSHLQHPPTSTAAGIDAWALTCEPPLGLNASAKAAYLDEADQFYAGPNAWLKLHMSRHPPPPIVGSTLAPHEPDIIDNRDRELTWRERKNGGGRRPWPQYLVFFQQLEPEMKNSLGSSSGYAECWRGFNSHWHDDWRRQGDVIVWCLFPERSTTSASAAAIAKTEAERTADAKQEQTKKTTLPDSAVVGKAFRNQRPLG
ncbi:hypothetical protein DV735_g4652, partial [Chaetothyriales sp. CBS 134920]